MLLFQRCDTFGRLMLGQIDEFGERLLQHPLLPFVEIRPDFGGVEHLRVFGCRPLQPFHDPGIVRRCFHKTLPGLFPRIPSTGQQLRRLERPLLDGIETEIRFALLAEGFPLRLRTAFLETIRIAQPA